ncbi:hypothetical protein [Desmospora profundinema]|uniref:Uncharacterized protein n=1 Tax=Desmospora profundinema TaxID=1571184 RepID=A0ABU1IK19_9BACL|nr:hypothetical protein [Desmospora profundinema]MDR6224887.1 hypothetical protein [Desmospora profundinema]
MRLRIKSIAGLIRTKDHVDSTLRSQGFVGRSGQYDIRIQDSASGHVYRLRIPTYPHSAGERDTCPMMRLGEPSIHCNRGSSRFQSNKADIPSPIVEAANDKLAEIVSYLHSRPTLP